MDNNKVQICLDNNTNGIYHPGQIISGRIECFFNEGDHAKFLKIHFKGLATTSWAESETYYDDFFKEERTRDVMYNDEEVYFSAEYNLFQSNNEDNVLIGRSSHPFSYVLPQQLPSSFEEEHGSVTYTIKATMEYSQRSTDVSIFKLNIITPLDLNLVPGLRQPVAISIDKTPCSCWCQNSGPITFNVSVPVTGFVPGQEVNVGAYVENMSNLCAESVKFQIMKNILYKVNLPFRTHSSEEFVVDCYESGIGAHSEKAWTSTLLIPPIGSYPNLTACNLIEITYYLRGTLVLPMPHTNLCECVKLVIGSIPLSGVNIGLPGPPQSYLATAPPLEGDNISTRGINISNGPQQNSPNLGWSLSGEGVKNFEFIDALPSYEQVQEFQKN